ncbi:hypothetical protein EJO83_27005 [Salmonella enterica]|uniref:DUF4277 domain-containing protein n=1 Tax=Salmonella diarizonae TaxID=59204 RepID=A0A5Y1YF11_SALDZ|nr:hypothetical protein [Salmonella enterica]EBE1092841.1 hypothetical protein [Salmonella enterica]EBX5401887.1 hypothetical protein [Salmonella enterica subsp. enterica serovar Java]ECC3917348.1 hypothetical protein [Salmonella enterica subsp. diarizonae]ECO8339907.1 hypothetical protein [Salmonella enterica]
MTSPDISIRNLDHLSLVAALCDELGKADNINDQRGCGCFPGRFYCAMPSCRRYISGLSAPGDSLIRCSLYHRM